MPTRRNGLLSLWRTPTRLVKSQDLDIAGVTASTRQVRSWAWMSTERFWKRLECGSEKRDGQMSNSWRGTREIADNLALLEQRTARGALGLSAYGRLFP